MYKDMRMKGLSFICIELDIIEVKLTLEHLSKVHCDPIYRLSKELRGKLQIAAFDGCYQMLSDCLLFMEFIVKLFYNLFDVSVD